MLLTRFLEKALSLCALTLKCLTYLEMGCKRLQPSARRLKQKDYLHGNTWQRPLLANGYEIQKCEWTWASPYIFAQVSTLHLCDAPLWLLLPDSMRGNTEAVINLAGKVVTGVGKDLYRNRDSSSRRWRREHIGEKKRRALGTHSSSTQLLSLNGILQSNCSLALKSTSPDSEVEMNP